jgi:hypothetical protein
MQNLQLKSASILPDSSHSRWRHFPGQGHIVSGEPVEEDLVGDGWTEIFGSASNPGATPEERQMADFANMEAVRSRIDHIVRDPATADALKPWYLHHVQAPLLP